MTVSTPCTCKLHVVIGNFEWGTFPLVGGGGALICRLVLAHLCTCFITRCVCESGASAHLAACTHACALAHLGCSFIRGIMVKWNAEIPAASG